MVKYRSMDKKKLLLFIFPIIFLIILFLFLFSSAFANTVKTGVLSFFEFINDTVVLNLKEGVCGNYISSANDKAKWPDNSYRTNVAIKACGDVKNAKIQNSGKLEMPLSNPISTSSLSTASSSKAKNNFLNSLSVEIINKIYPKIVANNPVVAVESSSTAVVVPTVPIVTVIGGIYASDIFNLTNIERQKVGDKNLKENALLDEIAKERLDDMFAKGYFEHTSPQGISASDIAKTLGYGYLLIGENIALGKFSSGQELVTAWMNSEGHRANILNSSFTEIGVYAQSGNYNGSNMVIGVQIFGRPTSSCPYPDTTTKTKLETETSQANTLVLTAKTDLSEMNAMEAQLSIDSTTYNLKVSEYNTLVKQVDALYADIKILTDNYNAQVRNYNTCIGSIK